MADCNHELWNWIPQDCNECGWQCAACKLRPGEPPGYSPLLDRMNTRDKVACLMHHMNTFDLVYFSNSGHGEAVESAVVARAHEEKSYDQYSICRFILEAVDHTKFWRDIGEAVIEGRDERKRCKCGALSTISSGQDGVRIYSCSACWAQTKIPW